MNKPANNRLFLVGRRFGSLVVMSEAAVDLKLKKSRWECICDCGAVITVHGSSLTTGNTKSCGCKAKEAFKIRITTHGKSGTRAYRIWRAMISRCNNRSVSSFAHYGGRGISVCERWVSSFEAFYEDMGEPPEFSSIDRINNDLGYSPDNCRWADKRTQARNTRRNRMITFSGKTKCLTEWAQDLGMDQSSLAERLSRKTVEEALTQPKAR